MFTFFSLMFFLVNAMFASKGQTVKPSEHSMDKKIISDSSSLMGAVETYQKYEKMKKMGIPILGIKNKMKLDGFTDRQVAQFAGEKLPLLNGVDLTKHNLKKYERMKKVKLPDGAIRSKMRQDKIDAKVIATFFDEEYDEPEDDEEKGNGDGGVMQPPCPKPNMSKLII